MAPNEVEDRVSEQPGDENVLLAATGAAPMLAPASAAGACDTCGSMTASFVYALGRTEPRFPTLAVEKEFAQASGRAETAGLTDRQALHSVLSQRQNRYLLRQLCWVLTIEGLETYLLQPRDPGDIDLLLETLRPVPSPLDLDVVIGVRGVRSLHLKCATGC